MDEGVAALESGDLALVVVDADDVVAHFSKTDGGDQADISRSDYGNLMFSLIVCELMSSSLRITEDWMESE